jgi:hypothetical protein
MSIETADNILHVKNSTMRISRVEVGQTLSVGNIEFDTTTTLASVTSNGNNTPYTISSSNVTTGLVTTANVVVGKDLAVSGNATVTGDLNVSGALGILDAIYPVGTVIDRATAITDTHPNGKYKAFLAAPNQEWELVSDGQNKVLEKLSSPCDKTSLYGRATIQNVTTQQTISLTAAVASGSLVTGFTPVSGTKFVEYEYIHQIAHDGGGSALTSYQLYYQVNGGSWIEVVSARQGSRATAHAVKKPLNWTFTLGASSSIPDDGVLTEVNPTLGFKVEVEEYDSTNQSQLHTTTYWQQSAADIFTRPLIIISSIGTKSLEYKRTL